MITVFLEIQVILGVSLKVSFYGDIDFISVFYAFSVTLSGLQPNLIILGLQVAAFYNSDIFSFLVFDKGILFMISTPF